MSGTTVIFLSGSTVYFCQGDYDIFVRDYMYYYFWPGTTVIFLSGINTPSNTLIPLDASLSTGAKMSKSLGNVVDPVEILKKYTADTVRFYMIRETYYGDDAPFNQEHMEDLHNSNLADAVSPRISN